MPSIQRSGAPRAATDSERAAPHTAGSSCAGTVAGPPTRACRGAAAVRTAAESALTASTLAVSSATSSARNAMDVWPAADAPADAPPDSRYSNAKRHGSSTGSQPHVTPLNASRERVADTHVRTASGPLSCANAPRAPPLPWPSPLAPSLLTPRSARGGSWVSPPSVIVKPHTAASSSGFGVRSSDTSTAAEATDSCTGTRNSSTGSSAGSSASGLPPPAHTVPAAPAAAASPARAVSPAADGAASRSPRGHAPGIAAALAAVRPAPPTPPPPPTPAGHAT
eukprot:358857-Chlamydomonas_euryale.AAC.4